MLPYVILTCICVYSFSIRIFSAIRWEAMIHDYDPYFNYRATKFVTVVEFEDFLNWFDDRSWYPLGRIIGGTVFPGLMMSANALYTLAHKIGLPIAIRNVCVFLAPIFASGTSLGTYKLAKEVTDNESAALLAAALIAGVPSYISRSAAGSFDNEGVAVCAMVWIMALWLKAIRTGYFTDAIKCAMVYAYMVCSWGGYTFVINLIPLHVLTLLLTGKYSTKLYIGYTTFYVIGSLLAMQVPFVGFNIVKQAEALASHGIFCLLQVCAFSQFIQPLAPQLNAKMLIKWIDARKSMFFLIIIFGLLAGSIVFTFIRGELPWSGRSLTLLIPTYAAKYVPIIASVSEHQPPVWATFYRDFGPIVIFVPLGTMFLVERMNQGTIFMLLYSSLSWYFASLMVRLTLVLAPAVSIVSAFGISTAMSEAIKWQYDAAVSETKQKPQVNNSQVSQNELFDMAKACLEDKSYATKRVYSMNSHAAVAKLCIFFPLLLLLSLQVHHNSNISSKIYSSASISSSRKNATDGSNIVFDDTREAYFWLRQNTREDAKIMSWWDYGYQISSMANRTVYIDNNTWNNTHIATIGLAFGLPEERAYPILQSLNVDYILVHFGGYNNHASDDLNKFAWFLRIAEGEFPQSISESNFIANNQYNDVSESGPIALRESLLYKLSYFRFNEVPNKKHGNGYDNVRMKNIANTSITFSNIEEAYTTEHWMVRIYKVTHQTVNPSIVRN